MYTILSFCSVILALVIAFIGGETSSYNCKHENFYAGMVVFFLLSLPAFFLYLGDINKSESKKRNDLEFAQKFRWIFPKAYALEKHPVLTLFISIFFGVASISMMFSKKCM